MRMIAIYIAALYLLVTVAFPDKPQITQSVTGILGFVFLLSRLEETRLRLPNRSLSALLIFCGWFSISLLWTPSQELGFIIFWRFFVIILLIIITWTLVRNLNEVAILIQGFVLGSVYVFFDLYRNFAAGKGMWGTGSGDQMRYSADGFQPNTVGLLLAFATGLSWLLAVWNLKSTRPLYLLNCVFPVLAVIGVIATGSRSGMLALVINLIPLCVFVFKRPAGAAALAIFGVLLIPAAISSPRIQGSLARVTGATDTSLRDPLTGRGGLWQAAFEISADRPFIGTGVGGFRSASTEVGLNTTGGESGAHNAFLQLLAETGLIGVSLYVCFLLCVFAMILRLNNPIKLILVCLFFGVMAMFQTSMEQTRLLTLYPILFMILIAEFSNSSAGSRMTSPVQGPEKRLPV